MGTTPVETSPAMPPEMPQAMLLETPPLSSNTTPLEMPPETSLETPVEMPVETPPLSLRFQMVRINSTSSTSTTPRCSTRVTGPLTRSQDPMIMTAPLPNPTTGRELNNALSHGSAEVLDSVREADGAPVSMDVRDPHSQPKLRVSPPPTERQVELPNI